MSKKFKAEVQKMGFATNFFGLWISDGNTLTRVSGITYGYITYVYGTLIH